MNKFEQLHKLVGDTPLIKINYLYEGVRYAAYFKAEWCNFSGSVKDRMALSILEKAYENRQLKTGQPIIEATSGNTGIALAAMGAYLGNPVIIIMPETVSEERRKLIQSFGAKLQLEGAHPRGLLHYIDLANNLAKQEGGFLPMQFENEHNKLAHEKTTAPEILSTLEKNGQKIDAFVVGVGTGGTIMGVSNFLKSEKSTAKIIAVSPAESPILKTKKRVGGHKIQGLNGDFVPELINYNLIDDILEIKGDDAVMMAQKLACELGLGVGISSGANFLGAVLINNQLGKNKVVVSVFPDDNKKYLSTALCSFTGQEKSGILKKIKLLDYYVL